MRVQEKNVMDALLIYLGISVLAFVIGILAGHLIMTKYYERRFLTVATECETVESIVPIINEMDRES